MRKVEVDLADLESLVFATAVIKTIEGALAQRQNDPFIKPHLPLTEVHNRLASAMRNATRAEAGTKTNWDEPLTEEERGLLEKINSYVLLGDPPLVFQITPNERLRTAEFDTLLAKGCIVLGTPVSGVIWSGDSKPELVKEPLKLLVKLTPRGVLKMTKVWAFGPDT